MPERKNLRPVFIGFTCRRKIGSDPASCGESQDAIITGAYYDSNRIQMDGFRGHARNSHRRDLADRPDPEPAVAFADAPPDTLRPGPGHGPARAGTAVIIIGAILTALPEFGFNVTPIAAAAGLASLAVGFGAQHLVRDLINGFFIIVEDQFAVGESVRIGTVVGRVEHLTLRRTVVRDIQGAVVSIPNGEISQVANLSRDWGQVFVDISIPLEASSNAALTALERVCSELRADISWSPVLVDGPRALGIDSFGPAGVTLRLQLRTVPGRQDDAARELRRLIQNRFDQEHIR